MFVLVSFTYKRPNWLDQFGYCFVNIRPLVCCPGTYLVKKAGLQYAPELPLGLSVRVDEGAVPKRVVLEVAVQDVGGGRFHVRYVYRRLKRQRGAEKRVFLREIGGVGLPVGLNHVGNGRVSPPLKGDAAVLLTGLTNIQKTAVDIEVATNLFDGGGQQGLGGLFIHIGRSPLRP